MYIWTLESSVDLLIDELNEESAVFVTNAIGHAQKLLKKGYEVLLIGGKLKGVTEAIVVRKHWRV